MSNVLLRRTSAALGLLAATFCFTQVASAQAWVEEKGVLGVGSTYQYDFADTIVEDGGSIEFQGDSSIIQTLILSSTYAPIEKLGLSLNIPIMFPRYTGEGSLFFPHGEWDDGNSHVALQDLRLGARYMALTNPLVVTPNIGFSVPMSDYPIQGFTAPGRGVMKLHLGLSVARTLDPILPNLFFHANYEFSLATKVDAQPELEDFGQNHSQFGIQAGYFISDKLSAALSFDGFLYHDGLDLIDYFDFPAAARDYHDAVLKEQVMLVGANVGYQITDRLSAAVFGRMFVSGDNTRKSRQIGFSLNFDIPVAVDPLPEYEEEEEPGEDEPGEDEPTEEAVSQR